MIFIVVNMVTAAIALALMVLVTIGFAPHLRWRWRGHDANSLMSLFVAATSGLVWVRLLWWSLLRPVLGWSGWMSPLPFNPSGQIINTMFNVWAIVAAAAALGALHRSLPEHEKRHYTWMTAPFYPRKFNIVWRW